MDGHGPWNKGKSFSGGIVQTSSPFLIQRATKSHSLDKFIHAIVIANHIFVFYV